METGHFYYMKYVDCCWEDSKNQSVLIKIRIDYTETHSEDFFLRLNLKDNKFSCLDEKMAKRPEIKNAILDNQHYLNTILEKVHMWMDGQTL